MKKQAAEYKTDCRPEYLPGFDELKRLRALATRGEYVVASDEETQMTWEIQVQKSMRKGIIDPVIAGFPVSYQDAQCLAAEHNIVPVLVTLLQECSEWLDALNGQKRTPLRAVRRLIEKIDELGNR